MSNGHRLLDRTLQGLSELKRKGQSVPEWVLGGGTALMILADHRLSRDIDAFIDDPQYTCDLDDVEGIVERVVRVAVMGGEIETKAAETVGTRRARLRVIEGN